MRAGRESRVTHKARYSACGSGNKDNYTRACGCKNVNQMFPSHGKSVVSQRIRLEQLKASFIPRGQGLGHSLARRTGRFGPRAVEHGAKLPAAAGSELLCDSF